MGGPSWTSQHNLLGFLGLAGYYRKFVKDYAKVAGLLTNLLKKNSFEWCDKAEQAFIELKEALSYPPILAFSNFSKQFVLESDAS